MRRRWTAKYDNVIPNNIDNYDIQEYKECAGKNCKNHDKHELKIKYIHKFGWFCNICRQDLKDSGLVDIKEMMIR